MLNKFLIVNFKNYCALIHTFFLPAQKSTQGQFFFFFFCLSLSGLNFVYTFSFLSFFLPVLIQIFPWSPKYPPCILYLCPKNGKDNDAVSVAAVSTWPLQNRCHPSILPSLFIIYKNFSKMGSSKNSIA